MIPTVSRRTLTVAVVLVLLAIMEGCMLLSVRQESQTCDEAYDLLAGYLHLTSADFSSCPAHPPLTADVSALPFLALRPRVPPMTEEETSDFVGGREFLYANRADQLLFAARVAMTVFPLLLAALVFLATREMFGMGPAFIALGLIVFEPNFLAHGPMATNDVGLACCLFAVVYAFWRYAVKSSAWRLVACGIAAGLTLATKHSGMILFPILFLLATVELLIQCMTGPVTKRGSMATSSANSTQAPAMISHGQDVRGTAARWRLARRLLMSLVTTAVISVVVLWSFYYFRYSAKPTGTAFPPAWAPMLGQMRRPAAAAAIAWVARAHLLPEAFLEGLAFFFATDTRPTYLLGTRYLHGVWFYFPTAFVIKSTLGFLLLLLLAPFARLLRDHERRREALWMLIPAVVFLAASMTSNLNIGLRHILPLYPFLIVLAAAGAWKLAQKHRAWQFVVGGLLLFHAASSVRAFPNYLPYSNELWGGPSKTYQVLTDSNVDWGQGLLAVKRYLATHSAKPCWFAYFGTADPGYYDLPCTLLTVHSAVIWGRLLDVTPPVIEGTVLVGATEMSGQAWGGGGELNPYDQFRTARPVDCLAGSILVYQGSFQVPLASAQSRVWRVMALERQRQFDAAIAEAHEAESLAPQSVDVQFLLGRVFKAAGRNAEARQAFENALRFAVTIHPELQSYWIPMIGRELNTP